MTARAHTGRSPQPRGDMPFVDCNTPRDGRIDHWRWLRNDQRWLRRNRHKCRIIDNGVGPQISPDSGKLNIRNWKNTRRRPTTSAILALILRSAVTAAPIEAGPIALLQALGLLAPMVCLLVMARGTGGCARQLRWCNCFRRKRRGRQRRRRAQRHAHQAG